MKGPRFCADVMLGRLGKWMRIAGFDTTYVTSRGERRILDEAWTTKRITLSRRLPPSAFRGRVLREADGEEPRLLRHVHAIDHAPPIWFVLTSDAWRRQFAALMRELGTSYEDLEPATRCARCNGVLEEVLRRGVQGLVPDYVYRTQTRFLRCPDCLRIYWSGTHSEHIRDELQSIFLGHLFRCDHCGVPVPTGATKYRGLLELSSIYERLDLKEQQDEADHWSEIERLMGQIATMSQEELTESVHARVDFTLCTRCRRTFLDLIKSFLRPASPSAPADGDESGGDRIGKHLDGDGSGGGPTP